MAGKQEVVIIKKYSNRRLYNTETSSYITLDDVCKLVKDGCDFEVQDAKTGEDLTRQVLTQIIFEQELKGQSVFPVGFLKGVIGMYDDSISEVLPHYLESSLEGFVENQEKIRQVIDKTWKEYNPLGQLGEIGRQNMEIFSQTMKMFNPFEAIFALDDEKDREKSAAGIKAKKKTS